MRRKIDTLLFIMIVRNCDSFLFSYHHRVASMTLAPVHKRIGFSKKRKSVTWRDRQHAIIELLNETSTLIDIFAEVSIMLGPQIELNPIPQLDSIEIKDSEWEPKLSDSCDILEKSLFNFQSKALY